MSRVARWTVATVVTVATFGISLWVSALVLPHFIKSEADRWVVAAGLAVAVAALAALGAGSWAHRDPETPPLAPGARSISAGGDITGIASTGDHTTNIQRKK